LGRPANSALRVHGFLERNPMASIARISKETGLTHPTVTSALRHLERLGVARPATDAKYGRQYAYHRYLKVLSEGTEPLR
jgi:DNA-binding IclR family transcriptional regulator